MTFTINEDDDIVCGTAVLGFIDRESNTVTCRLNGATTKFSSNWSKWLKAEIQKAVKEIS